MPNAKKDADGLTAKQRMFAEAFAQTGDKMIAARAAGYSETKAASAACENLKLPTVQAVIDRYFDAHLRREGIKSIKALAHIRDNARNESARYNAAKTIAERGGAQVKPKQIEAVEGLTAAQILAKLNDLATEIGTLKGQLADKQQPAINNTDLEQVKDNPHPIQ
mgnify:CR=1 FL=1